MPTIATATIDVHYEGKGLPEEAREDAEEAGEEAGKAHQEAFNDEVEKGQKDLADELHEKWQEEGQEDGDRYGTKFTDSLRNRFDRDLSRVSDDVAKIFGDTDGLERFADSFDDLDDATDALDHDLAILEQNGLLEPGYADRLASEWLRFRDAYQEVKDVRLAEQLDKDWEAAQNENKAFDDLAETIQHNRDVMADHVEDLRTLRQVSQDLTHDEALYRDGLARSLDIEAEQRDALAKTEGAKKDLDRVMTTESLQRFIADASGSKDGVAKLRQAFVDLEPAFKTSIGDLRTAIQDGEGDIEGLTTSVDTNRRHFGLLGDALGISKKAMHDVEIGAKDAGRVLGDLDQVAENIAKDGPKTESALSGIAAALEPLAGFDPGDDLGALIVLIVGFAGPLAALLSAVAAQAVILGTAFAAGAAGAGALIGSFALLFKLKDLPGPIADARDALRGLVAPLQDLGRTLLTATFANMAQPFRDLKGAIEDLSPAATAIGGALNGFLRDLTGAVKDNAGAIDSLLTGFAPIISNLGSVFLSVIGIVGGILKAATPFADALTASIAGATKKFSDFINSVQGQQALQKWFADAQPVLSQLGKIIGDAGKAFEGLITPETKSELTDLLSDIDDILIKLPAVSDALSPAAGAIGDLIAFVVDLVADFAPVIDAVAQFAQVFIQNISTIVGILATVFHPAIAAIGTAIGIISDAFGFMNQAAGKAGAGIQQGLGPVNKMFDDIFASVRNFIDNGLKQLTPLLAPIQGAFAAIYGAVGDLITGFAGAVTQTDLFKGAGDTLSGFMNGGLKTAVANAVGAIKNFTDGIRNGVIPAIKEIDWGKVTDGLNHIADIIPNVIRALGDIVTALGANLDEFSHWVTVVSSAANAVGTIMTGAAKVVSDVLHGNFIGAFNDSITATKNAGVAVGKFQSDTAAALAATNTDAVTSGRAFNDFQATITKVMADGKTAIADFQAAGKGNLAAMATSLGLTGDASTAFRTVVAGAAHDAGVSLDTLAKARSLPDIEKALGDAGDAGKSRFAAQIIAAMHDSGVSVDQLPPKIQALIAKYGDLPTSKNTKVTEEGAEAARQAAVDLAVEYARIPAQVNTDVVTTYHQVGNGPKYSATGSIFDGLNINRYADKFASGGFPFGGTTSGKTWLSPLAIAGEAGPEAIVPLSGALGSIDRTVRPLAAYARGLAPEQQAAAGTYHHVEIHPGAIVIQQSGYPGQTADAVMDRLSAAIGG